MCVARCFVTSDDPGVRVNHGGADTVTELRRLVAGLDSPDKAVRDESSRALGRVRAFENIHVLIEALFDDDASLSAWAATTLGLRGDSRAMQPLIDLLAFDEPDVREAAASALGLLGDEDAVDRLAEALQDPDPGVARAAAFALTRLGDHRGESAASDGLVRQLVQGDEEERSFAARTLGALRADRSCEPLVDALGDPCPDVRADAAEALGKIADPRALPALLQAGFKDADQTVRDTAMFALSRMTAAPEARPV